MKAIHYIFMALAVLTWLTIFNSCTSEQRKIDKPRLETVLEASERHMQEYEKFRKSPAYTVDAGEDYLRSHISALQGELKIGAEENRQLQRDRNDWQSKYEADRDAARKWNTLEFSFWAVVIVSGFVCLLLFIGWIYLKFSPAGAAASTGTGLIASLLSLIKR